VDLRHIAVGVKVSLNMSYRATGTEAGLPNCDGRNYPPFNLGDGVDSMRVKVRTCANTTDDLRCTTTYAEATKMMTAASGRIGEFHVTSP
jgi:hypothetical protein